ncbi:hypothetical protein FXO37_30247 [Capsicum annuum]|nr:hypothetical protein FXO37_30247 [Capsicum annuum]
MPLAIQVWLYECCSNVPRKVDSKVDNQIFRLLSWKTNTPRPHFEYLMASIFNEDGKVLFKNIEPTRRKISKFEIPQQDGAVAEPTVDSDDDFQDPPPKQTYESSKKKQEVDPPTSSVKKPLKQQTHNVVDEHT